MRCAANTAGEAYKAAHNTAKLHYITYKTA